MTMTAPTRNIVLTIHVITSVGWLGALAVFFAHSLAVVLMLLSGGHGPSAHLSLNG